MAAGGFSYSLPGGLVMTFDYETVPDRIGKDAIAVDYPVLNGFLLEKVIRPGFDRIPMWVADMNYMVPSCITDKIAERLAHPSFGYFSVRDEYYQAIMDWHRLQNGVVDLGKGQIGYENGLLGGLVSTMKVLLPEGGKVLLHSPAYIGFTHVLKDNGYEIIHSGLVKNAGGIWRMDFDDMETKIREHNIKVAVFCSPHNPSGRVWTLPEMEKAASLFEKYGVKIISDEIWSDLILFGNKHIPFSSVSDYAHENTVELYAPSKTFNLAGLVGSYHIIYNEKLRNRIEAFEGATSYNHMNVLSMYALIGAYSEEGRLWVEGLIRELEGNIEFAMEKLQGIDGLSVSKPEGTYMMFLDFEGYCMSRDMKLDDLIKKGMEVGVLWQDGRPFGGEYTIRLNLASPKHRIEEAFGRLQNYVFAN